MKKLFILLALAPVLSFAAVAPLSFNRPTTYADGSPLAAADIDGYELRCVSFNGGACSIPAVPLPGTFASGNVTVAVPSSGGNACFHVVTNVNALFSVPSNQACKVFPAVAPGPPTNVTIAVVIDVNTSPAFTYNSSNQRAGQVAGFVAHGIPCIGSCVFNYRGKCYRRVAQADVRWWNTTPQTRVAAPCAAGQVVGV